MSTEQDLGADDVAKAGGEEWRAFRAAADAGWQLVTLRSGLERAAAGAELDPGVDRAGRITRFQLKSLLDPPAALSGALDELAGGQGASAAARLDALDEVEQSLIGVTATTWPGQGAFELGRTLGWLSTPPRALGVAEQSEAFQRRFDEDSLRRTIDLVWATAVLPPARRVALADALARMFATALDRSAKGLSAARELRELLLAPPGDLERRLLLPYLEGSSARTTRRRSLRRHRRALASLTGVVAAAVIAALLVHAYALRLFTIDSGSMSPTLDVGDTVLVETVTSPNSVNVGDVIAFSRVDADREPPPVPDLIKRVVAVGGETVSSRGNELVVDGKVQSEPWLPTLTGACAQTDLGVPPQRVPNGSYFVLGDCRGDSLDSRAWGTVPATHVIGKVVTVVWRHGHPWLHWL